MDMARMWRLDTGENYADIEKFFDFEVRDVEV